MERTIFEDEHEQFRSAVRQFLTREVAGRNDDFERAGIVDRDVFLAAGTAGFLGFAVPEEHGGGGVRDFRYNAVLGEEAARLGIGSVGLGLTLHTDICQPYFLDLTTDEQKGRWLPGIASGDLITAVAMTEPAAGSDLAAITTTAERDGDDYVVNVGAPIGALQNTKFRLAELATEVTVGQAFVDRCIIGLNAGDLSDDEAAMAKLWCTELQGRAVDLGVQLHGGYGYMAEYRSPGPTPTPGSPASTAAPQRS